MTAPDDPPICWWCGQPVEGEPTLWDGRPQCRDPFKCDKRMQEVEQ